MTIRTIYTCDKCKAEQVNADQFWTVSVLVSTNIYPNRSPALQIQVCLPCLESFGIYVRKDKDAPPPTNPPATLEDAITEIVRRCIEEQKS